MKWLRIDAFIKVLMADEKEPRWQWKNWITLKLLPHFSTMMNPTGGYQKILSKKTNQINKLLDRLRLQKKQQPTDLKQQR